MLITNTETITEEIDNNERVQVDDVARLWRGIPGSNLCHKIMLLTPPQSILSTALISKTTEGQGSRTFSGGYGATKALLIPSVATPLLGCS